MATANSRTRRARGAVGQPCPRRRAAHSWYRTSHKAAPRVPSTGAVVVPGRSRLRRRGLGHCREPLSALLCSSRGSDTLRWSASQQPPSSSPSSPATSRNTWPGHVDAFQPGHGRPSAIRARVPTLLLVAWALASTDAVRVLHERRAQVSRISIEPGEDAGIRVSAFLVIQQQSATVSVTWQSTTRSFFRTRTGSLYACCLATSSPGSRHGDQPSAGVRGRACATARGNREPGGCA